MRPYPLGVKETESSESVPDTNSCKSVSEHDSNAREIKSVESIGDTEDKARLVPPVKRCNSVITLIRARNSAVRVSAC